MDSVKNKNYFENFDHRIGGMGHIESGCKNQRDTRFTV